MRAMEHFPAFATLAGTAKDLVDAVWSSALGRRRTAALCAIHKVIVDSRGASTALDILKHATRHLEADVDFIDAFGHLDGLAELYERCGPRGFADLVVGQTVEAAQRHKCQIRKRLKALQLVEQLSPSALQSILDGAPLKVTHQRVRRLTGAHGRTKGTSR